jgi:hypothetical protein
MAPLLIRRATLLVTMDTQRREIADGAVFAGDGVIEAVGSPAQLPQTQPRAIELPVHRWTTESRATIRQSRLRKASRLRFRATR